MNFIKSKILNTPILFIVCVGIIIRLLFWAFAAKIILGDNIYTSGDTVGWTQSFLNLLHYGHYTFDLTDASGYFGRVPGYSFYWGLHYLLSGSEYVYQAVAATQIILDCICIYLVYKISLLVFNDSLAAKISALLYCFYPFAIIWVTVSYSEILSNFLNILCIYLSLKPDKKNSHFFILGLLLAVLFLTREFVAISLFFICLYTLFDRDVATYQKRFKNATLIFLSFLLLYSIWPIRNYINHDRFILSRSNEGFSFYKQDFREFRSWIICWDNDETFWINDITKKNYITDFPEEAKLTLADKKLLQETLLLCRDCGSSFAHWETFYGFKNPFRKKGEECNELIAKNFSTLRSNYIKNNRLAFFTRVPLMNLQKAVLKTKLVNRSTSTLQRILLSYRSLLIILGLIGVFLSIKNYKIIPIAGYVIFIYLFFSLIIRHIEMRNLLQADTLLVIMAGFAIVQFYKYSLRYSVNTKK